MLPPCLLRVLCPIVVFSLLSVAVLQHSYAQDNQSPDYSFRVGLPPIAEQNNRLSLPDLPLYDQENLYLQVRDSSQDWYNVKILNEKAPQAVAVNQVFTSQTERITAQPSSEIRNKREGKASRLLDADKRIIPEFSDVLLDESLVPIPSR